MEKMEKELLQKYEAVKGYSTEVFDNEDWAEFESFKQGYNLAATEARPAILWAVEQFTRLASEGKYPEFMLTENGGYGIMPLIETLKKITTE